MTDEARFRLLGRRIGKVREALDGLTPDEARMILLYVAEGAGVPLRSVVGESRAGVGGAHGQQLLPSEAAGETPARGAE